MAMLGRLDWRTWKTSYITDHRQHDLLVKARELNLRQVLTLSCKNHSMEAFLNPSQNLRVRLENRQELFVDSPDDVYTRA